MANTNAPAAAFPITDRIAREMSAQVERDRRRLIDSAAHMLARRDLAAEKRPTYAARMVELAADPAQLAALDKPAALALCNTLRALPVLPDPEPEQATGTLRS